MQHSCFIYIICNSMSDDCHGYFCDVFDNCGKHYLTLDEMGNSDSNYAGKLYLAKVVHALSCSQLNETKINKAKIKINLRPTTDIIKFWCNGIIELDAKFWYNGDKLQEDINFIVILILQEWSNSKYNTDADRAIVDNTVDVCKELRRTSDRNIYLIPRVIEMMLLSILQTDI